jgi:hypothetical protein
MVGDSHWLFIFDLYGLYDRNPRLQQKRRGYDHIPRSQLKRRGYDHNPRLEQKRRA